jgi:predicted flap endonuclease-1-like 5' DNA nuclease
MLPRLLFALSFALSGVIASTGSAFAAFDPTRDELMGIMVAVVGVLLAFLTLVYAIKWYLGLDEQDPNNQELADYISSHHVVLPLALQGAAAQGGHSAPAAHGHAPEAHSATASHTPAPAAQAEPAAAAAGSPLIDIEGIGSTYAATLKEAGLETTGDLLAAAGPAAGRRELATKTGLAESQILEWVNHADLMRISGVGSEYSDLLEASGVDSVPELARRNPANLLAKLTEVNGERSLVRRLPSADDVEAWVAEAKTLAPAVSH